MDEDVSLRNGRGVGVRVGDTDEANLVAVAWWLEGCASEGKEDSIESRHDCAQRRGEKVVEQRRRVEDACPPRPRPAEVPHISCKVT